MSKHLSAFSVLFLLFFLKTQAQSSFQKATIINNKNDTLEGFMKYEGWSANPDFIVFKKTLNSEKTTILPTEIRSFRVNNDLYEAHTIKLETDLPEDTNETPPMDLKMSDNITVFMRCHVKGQCNLFSYTDDKGVCALYINKGKDTLQLLKSRRVTEVQQGFARIGKQEKYKRQLIKNLYEAPKLFPKIEKADYSIANIQAIIEVYNNNFKDKTPITYLSPQEKGKFKVYFLAGGHYSALKIESAPNFFSSGLIPNQTVKGFGFNLGVSTAYILPRRNNKYAFVNDLVFKTMRLYYNEARTNETTATNFDNMYLRLHSQAHFQLLKFKQLTISGTLGVAPNYVLKTDNLSVVTKSGIASNRVLFAKEDFRPFNVGYTAGLSVQLKNTLILELHGETNQGMSEFQTVGSRITSFNLGLKYLLY